MKKSQAAMEFLMTYGWAIVIVLVAIGALAYFGTFNHLVESLNDSTDKHVEVCSNLTKSINNEFATIYPAVLYIEDMVKENLMMNIYSTSLDKATPKAWDDRGVVCEVPSKACFAGLYCVDITLQIPINYSEYDNWKEDLNKDRR